ncbi:MAG: hypothetical protein MGF17_02370 [Trichodesmium sp. MAG_R04]|nr:hypothetical protein [Trichodesmium sp. MAG_R04]
MTSSPYKSKVLNFVVAKYHQILTQRDRAFRHLKFSAINTVQLLLYPVYVLLQTSRILFKQLRQNTKSELPQIKENVNQNHKTTEKPIQEVSRSSKQAYSRLLDSLKPKPMVKMQGKVFSELEIVDTDKLSDISTKFKQEKPLLQLQPGVEFLPTLELLGGIWQIMTWVQGSKIALWFNLFDESNIVLEQNELNRENKSLPLHQSQPLLSSSNLTLGKFIHNLAKHYLYPITRSLGLNGLLPPFKIEEEWEVESLLEAELNQENQQNPFVTQYETPIVASLISPFESKKFPIATSLTIQPPINPGDVEKSQKEKSFPLNKYLYYETTLTSNNYPKKEAITFKEVLREIDGQRTDEITSRSINISNSSRRSVQTYNLESGSKEQPNFLEVESISVGYVKHPLEIILGWVDLIMTWIEKIFAQVWQLYKQKSKNF